MQAIGKASKELMEQSRVPQHNYTIGIHADHFDVEPYAASLVCRDIKKQL